MNIHEYQAKALLRSYGAPVSDGRPVMRAEEAKTAAGELDGPLWVVKAQIHAGGRGKAGFVKLVKTADDATDAARFMLSNKMVSPQTGEDGLEVKKLLVAAGVDIAKEYYLAITTDRQTRRNVLIASAEGGVEIEKVAAETPEHIEPAYDGMVLDWS